MHGFIFSNASNVDYSALDTFQGQESIEVDDIKFVYSPVNSIHNHKYYKQDNAPFVFIYGEMNVQEAVAGEEEHPARWLSQQIMANGLSSIQGLDGLFAVVVYDLCRKTISICMDKIGGFCTLYYHVGADGVCCSTSFSQIARCIPHLKIDPDSISELISTGYVLPQRTLVKEIGKLGPGCVANVSGEKMSTSNFPVLPFLEKGESPKDLSGAEYILSYLQRYANDDVCFLLSGGLDSSTLVGMAAKELGQKINCYTGVFTGFCNLDESRYAKIVAKHCNVDLRCVELGHDDVLQNLPNIVESIGEPFLDYSILPTYALFKKIRKEFSAVFSGDGPDHLFNRYYSLAMKRTLGFIARNINLLPRNNKYVDRLWRSSSENIEYAYSELFALPHWGHNRREEMLNLLSPDLRRCFAPNYSKNILCDNTGKSHDDNIRLINLLDFYIDGSFGVFSKVGKAASALGLKIREPYLASPYAEFASKLPMNKKIYGSLYAQLMSKCTTKAHLREKISSKYIPESIITRSKGGFTPPLEAWLRDFLSHVRVVERFSKTSQSFLNMAQVNNIFSEFQNINKYGCLVFMLLSFDLWVRIFFEKQIVSNDSLNDIYL